MKVWAQTLTRKRGIRVNPEMTIYRSLAAVVAALQRGEVDGCILSIEEYAKLTEGLLGPPFLRDETNGKTHTEFVLLAPKGGAIGALKDLSGAQVAIHSGQHYDLGLYWLNAELAAAGLDRLDRMAARIEESRKMSAAVLSVFFGKSDACLVSKSAFESMVELNPQLGKRLEIILKSEPIIPSILCFRKTFAAGPKQALFREILHLDESVAGKQVLRMFKSDRMREISAEEMDRCLKILQSWRDTSQGSSEDPGALKGDSK
jgi:phosphonate transport system substrate-binding protein